MFSLSDLEIEKAIRGIIPDDHKSSYNGEYLAVEQNYNQSLQIDWVTAKVPFFAVGKLNGGNIINTTPDGEIEFSIDKRLPVSGSFDSRLSIRTSDILPDGNTYLIEISGNPAKWFQGHNIFGSDDLPNLIYETVLKLSEMLNCPQPDGFLSAVRRGNYTISRVDITGMFSLPSRSDVYAWLKHSEKVCRTRSGTALSKGSTVYLNKNSARWNVVFYSKGQEIEKHQLPRELSGGSLEAYADNKLRVELRLRRNELAKIGLNFGGNWLNVDPFSIYKDYVGRVEMSEQQIRCEDVFNIPKYARTTYELWSRGADIRQFMSDRKYYKDRKALLEFGIDISVPKPSDLHSNVIPLKRVLELKPAGVPDWAYGTNLMFEPRKLCGK